METLINLIPVSVIERLADSLFLKYINKWILLGAASAVAHGVITTQQSQIDAQKLIEIVAGGGVIALNHLIEAALHAAAKNQSTTTP